MILNFKLNIEESYKIYKQYKDEIIDRECYSNCIHLLVRHFLYEFQKEEYEIGYCYTGGKNYSLVRHCVLLKNNEVLDITIFRKYSKKQLIDIYQNNNIKYFIFAKLNIESLYYCLKKSNCNSDLQEALKEPELEFFEYILDKTYIFNSYVFLKYIKPLIKKN